MQIQTQSIGGEIRHIAAPRGESDIFATAEFNEKVSLWSIKQRKRLVQIRTNLDFGGRRLALIQQLGHVRCFTANFYGPVNAYDIEGNIVWSRRDLVGAQQLIPLLEDQQPKLGIGLEDQSYKIIQALDGKEVGQMIGVKEIYANAEMPNIFVVGSKQLTYMEAWNSSPRWQRPLQSFGLLDCALSPAEVAYSEAGGAMYCVGLDGKEKWVFQPERGHHLLRISWNRSGNVWMVIDWNYEQGGSKKLLRIDARGKHELIADIGAPAEAEFFANGDLVISSDGKVLDSQTGSLIWHFLENSPPVVE